MNAVTVCNGALRKIGQPPITALSDSNKAGRACNAEYDKIRKLVLRLYPWGFASDRVVLAPDPAAPAFGFTYQHELPSDYLRVIELVDYDGDYRVEGRKLLCDSDVVYLRYVKDVAVDNADDLYIEALEWYLAYTLSRYFTESETVRQEALNGFKQILPYAKFIQSTENSQRELEALDLHTSRWSRGFVRDPGTH